MDKSYNLDDNTSSWDLIVNYIETGVLPEGVNIIFGDGTVEISKDVEQDPYTEKEPSGEITGDDIIISPMTTYTVFSNSYEPVYSHLNIGSGTLSAFTGHYYWVANYRTSKTVNVYVKNPVKNVDFWDYDNNNTMEYRSGSVCNNPPTGSWSMTIYCNNSAGSYILGKLMREN